MKFKILFLFLLLTTFLFSQDTPTENLSFFDKVQPWITAITAVVTACTAITMLTPSQTDNKILSIILKILNLFAGNVLKNKNKDG